MRLSLLHFYFGFQFIYASIGYAKICQFPSDRQIIEDQQVSGARRLLVKWDLSIGDLSEMSGLPASPELYNYKKSVEKVLEIEPYVLLDRYAERAPRPDDLFNLKLVSSRTAGQIREVSCLESLLLDFQIKRTPRMASSPTEFLAYYLEKNQNFRVYMLTNDAEGVSGLGTMMQYLQVDLANGWIVVGNLHNHSFSLEDLSSNKPQGVLSPSATDTKLYNAHAAEMKLRAAYITNGFHTVEIKSESFPLFKAAE